MFHGDVQLDTKMSKGDESVTQGSANTIKSLIFMLMLFSLNRNKCTSQISEEEEFSP